jgi:hypothetical protein
MWVKATASSGNAIFINLAQVKLIHPVKDGEGSTMVFQGGDEITLQEPPAKLLIGLSVFDAQPPKQMTAEERTEARRLARQ